MKCCEGQVKLSYCYTVAVSCHQSCHQPCARIPRSTFVVTHSSLLACQLLARGTSILALVKPSHVHAGAQGCAVLHKGGEEAGRDTRGHWLATRANRFVASGGGAGRAGRAGLSIPFSAHCRALSPGGVGSLLASPSKLLMTVTQHACCGRLATPVFDAPPNRPSSLAW